MWLDRHCGLLLLLCVWSVVVSVLAHVTDRDLLHGVSDAYWAWKLREFPTFASSQHVHDYDHLLEDFTFAAFDRRNLQCKAFLRDLERIDPDELSVGDRQNLEVLKADLEYFTTGYKWRMYGTLTPVNFLEGIHRSPSFVKNMLFETESDFENYFARLRAMRHQIDQGIALMREAIRLNRTNHAVSMSGVLKQIEEGLEGQANHTYFYYPMYEANISRFNRSMQEYLQQTTLELIETVVQPSIHKLKEFLQNVYSKHTRSHYGVSNFTDGLQYYQACLRFHLSSDVSAEEVREIGLKEVARIKDNMEKIKEREGFHGDLADFMGHLRRTRRQEFFDRSSDELLQEFRYIIYQRIQPELVNVLTHIPDDPVRVEPMPYDGPTGSYGSGTFYANLRRAETRPTFTMMALALHEANPGHHLQITYTRQQTQPNFRRVLWGTKYYAVPFNFPWYTAYTEGWGLYAEYLGEEMGLYNRSSLELFGRYSSEIFRACRLVVDTGIHAFGMSREEAVAYIAAHTAIPRSQIEKEVDRYITWPGQACAYKMGELEILRLRRRAEKILGKTFKVKEFNNEVLRAGRVPLKILEKSIEQWISLRAASGATHPHSRFSARLLFICVACLLGTLLR